MVRTELATGARVDRFEIVKLLGTGGMGAVYEARDPELGRSVALKVIREPDPQLSIRLLREAQALAQLQHPNVVAVHDVGTDGEEVFVAMELVDGTSLDKLSPAPASWREVVDLFVQVGRGLVAAHEKGLVHRDIKPSNLFVGRDGRVRIGDFGLARRQRDDAPANIRIDDEVVPVDTASAATIDITTGNPPPATPASGLLSSPLTHQGTLVGTPKYMAPEQAAGRRATVASDQYSFCVALKEMLPSRAPGWLTRAVERGLEKDPAKRHRSMQALVETLAQTPGRRRRTTLVVAGTAGAAVIAAAFLVVADRPDGDSSFLPECDGGAEKIDAVWNAGRRAEVEAAFAATGLAFAKDAAARLTARLDRRRDEWVAMYSNACQATHLFRKQSPEMLERRMECLEERRADLEAFVAGLTTIAVATVEAADAEAQRVGDVTACADLDALAEQPLRPTDPELRRRYDALAVEVAALRAGYRLDRIEGLAEDAARAADEAEQSDWPRLAAEARYLEGSAHGHYGHTDKARAALESAARSAAAAGDDALEVEAWTRLIPIMVDAGEIEAAKTLLIAADAAVKRAGEPADARVRLLQAEGWIAGISGDLPGAEATLTRALDLAEREGSGDTSVVIQALSNLATVESMLAHHPQAIEHRRRALALSTERYGGESPSVADCLADLGRALTGSGDRAGGRATLLEALEVLEKVHGPDSPIVADALQSLANAQDDPANALRLIQRAAAIQEKVADNNYTRTLITLAQTYLDVDDKENARLTMEKALPLIEQKVGTETFEYAAAEHAYVRAVGCKARDRLDHAAKILVAELGPQHGLTEHAVAMQKECK